MLEHFLIYFHNRVMFIIDKYLSQIAKLTQLDFKLNWLKNLVPKMYHVWELT